MVKTGENTSENRRSKRACLTCKKRKKKCSGTLPCEYCCNTGNAHGCEYKTKLSKRTVKVSERYVTSLKSKIRSLEIQLSKLGQSNDNYSDGSESYIAEQNPLIENPNNLDQNNIRGSQEDEKIASKVFTDESHYKMKNMGKRKYFGDSSCASFLLRIKQVLNKPDKMNMPDEIFSSRSVMYEEKLTWARIKEIKAALPPICDVRDLFCSVERTIGADYLYIERNYVNDFVPKSFYEDIDNISRHFEILEFAEELALFFSYLALGHLFASDHLLKSDEGMPQGFRYFEKAVDLLGLLFKHFDECSGTSLIQSCLYVAYYSLSVDRGAFAFIMVGNAIRVAFALGIHKKSPSPLHNRIFWLCFLYDRLIAIRFGFPLMINENDIEIPLWHCSDENILSVSLEKYHFEAQVNLAKITTHIIQKIYTKNNASFIQNCYVVLKELKNWLDQLPSPLKFDYNDFQSATSRSTINLHINYNYLIILTTRSVLFYVFNKVVQSGKNTDDLFPEKLRHIITILLESSVQAAQIQSSILTKLHYDGKMINRSFLDCHYIFNSSIILILASFLQSLPNFLIENICDINMLFKRVQDNLDVLQRTSQFNIAAYNFNTQLTELIELISFDKSQQYSQGSVRTSSLPTSNIFDRNLASFEQIKDAEKSLPDLESLSHFDLSQVLDLIMINDNVSNTTTQYFDNDDFLKYSNFLF